jgi:hypothetical protein
LASRSMRFHSQIETRQSSLDGLHVGGTSGHV